MTCPACTAAQTNPRTAEMGSNCESCAARALAVIGAHLESKEAGKMTPHYIEVLQKVFKDRWEEGAKQVKAWAGVMNMRNNRANTP